MSTSDLDPFHGSLPQSWPDVETLAQLASEWFATPPGASTAAPTASSAPIETVFSPELPGEAELKALLAAPLLATPFEIAGDPAGQAFYFLEHAGKFGLGGIQVPGLEFPVEPAAAVGVSAPFDVNRIRQDFPILRERVNGRQLVWLDNAATTQKPQSVIDRLKYFYEHENSNIHRAAHELAARSTDAYEAAREKVRRFLNASSTNECIFVRGATEAINLVAQTWGRQNIRQGDEIVLSWLEHHANIVPWQRLAEEAGAKLRVIPVDDRGQVLLDEYGKLLNEKTKLVAFTQVSNALGTITPVRQIIEAAHAAGAKVLLDGAQAVSHMAVDVQSLNPDWYVFSGHKVFAPTGIGVLYGKEDLLNQMPPWQSGGNMISDVTFERTLYQNAPGRFEAGTGNIAGAVGLGAAIDYVTKLGMGSIAAYEHQLLEYATRLLREIPGLRLIGTADDKASVLSFVLKGFETHEVGEALNREGIAVRSGHHCAQPILRRFGLESTVRPSLAFYNTCADIDAMIAVLIRLADSRKTA
ncbi:MAG: family 2A encapsulin nanocompartment cargo protein cysteine desulfurase [Acidobacteriota bacterium]